MPYPTLHPSSEQDAPALLEFDTFRKLFPIEGDYIEFKRGISSRRLQDAVVAFSNADGGIVLFGVDDGGRPVGLDVGQETEAEIHAAVHKVISPGRYSLHTVLVEDRRILVLSVARRVEGFAQLASGSVLVRRGASNLTLIGTHLADFLRSRSTNRYELEPTPVPASEAEPELVDRLARAWGWTGEAAIKTRLLEKQMTVIHEGRRVLTVGGALLLLAEPHKYLGKAYIEVFRFEGETYDQRTELTGPLDAQIRAAHALIAQELGFDLVVLGATRHELPRIPSPALREVLANAVAHRSYELTSSPVRVELRPDRVVIESPGSLPEPVTIEHIRDQNAPRNINVIAALRRYHLAEDAGMGIDLIQDSMQAHLLAPPLFEEPTASVRVTFMLGSAVAPEERAWVREIERRGTIRPADSVLLVHATRGEGLTNQEVRDLLGVDSVQARAALQRLRDAGLLVQDGERGATRYRLAPDLRPPGGLGLSRDEMKSTMHAMAEQGPLTNQRIRERLNLDRKVVQALLHELVDEGKLVREGERRGTRYRLPGPPPLEFDDDAEEPSR